MPQPMVDSNHRCPMCGHTLTDADEVALEWSQRMGWWVYKHTKEGQPWCGTAVMDEVGRDITIGSWYLHPGRFAN